MVNQLIHVPLSLTAASAGRSPAVTSGHTEAACIALIVDQTTRFQAGSSPCRSTAFHIIRATLNGNCFKGTVGLLLVVCNDERDEDVLQLASRYKVSTLSGVAYFSQTEFGLFSRTEYSQTLDAT
jgi:hypothetical protein